MAVTSENLVKYQKIQLNSIYMRVKNAEMTVKYSKSSAARQVVKIFIGTYPKIM